MFFSRRYIEAKKALISFKDSALRSISIVLNKKEYKRIIKQKAFKDLVFCSNPYEVSELQTYTIFKNW